MFPLWFLAKARVRGAHKKTALRGGFLRIFASLAEKGAKYA
jgi:hypothetical protein